MINNIVNWLKNNWVIALPAFWLVVGLTLLLVYLCIFKSVNWTVLSGFATWVLAGGIGVAIWQIREARKSTNAQIAIGLFQELRSNETLKTLRYIYGLEPENIKNLSQDDKNKITYVLERLGMLGALIANGIIDEKLATEIYGGATALKCWYQLKDYIRGVENRQGLQWGMHVEDFAARALEYWKDYKPKWV